MSKFETSRLICQSLSLADYESFENGIEPKWNGFTNPYKHLIEGPNPLPHRIPRVKANPAYAEIGIVIAILKDSKEIIGSAGFHDFPNENGLIKINDEIIHYQYKTNNSFKNCTRAFSGTIAYTSITNSETFLKSSNDIHSKGSVVYNLRSLFLYEFFKKFKHHFAFGFEASYARLSFQENERPTPGNNFTSATYNESIKKLEYLRFGSRWR